MENKTYDIILDVDGTLWDTTDICARAWNAAISDNSDIEPNLTADRLKTLFGKPMNIIFAALFPGVGQEERDALAVKCCEYEELFLSREKVPLYKGVEDTVKILSERNGLYIVSNCQKGYIESFLENSGLGPFITGFMCYGDTLAPKDETMRRLIKKYGLQNPVYVGDTEGDARASRDAGVPFVYAAYGFGAVEEYWKKIDRFSGLQNLF